MPALRSPSSVSLRLTPSPRWEKVLSVSEADEGNMLRQAYRADLRTHPRGTPMQSAQDVRSTAVGEK